MKNKESLNKYIAGYVDGNGTITTNLFKTTAGYKPRLVVNVCGWRDRPKTEEMFQEVFDCYSFGSLMRKNSGVDKQCRMIEWYISGKEAESFINLIKKHLVIKGQHAERMIELWKAYSGYGNTVPNPDVFKAIVKSSRDNTGPIKPKNHVSWGWLAGYVDSDGYLFRRGRHMGLDFSSNKRDIAAHALISKSFGREVRNGRENEIRTRHKFPIKNSSLAKKILIPMLPHLRLKKWDAEQILAFYNTRRD